MKNDANEGTATIKWGKKSM